MPQELSFVYKHQTYNQLIEGLDCYQPIFTQFRIRYSIGMVGPQFTSIRPITAEAIPGFSKEELGLEMCHAVEDLDLWNNFGDALMKDYNAKKELAKAPMQAAEVDYFEQMADLVRP